MIVVTTPTGQIGQHVVRGLLDAGKDVRVIVRDPARLTADVAERVDIVQGSHSDPSVVMEAFEGASSVFYVAPPNPSTDDVEGYFRSVAEAVAPALTAHGVRRVVAVSSLGHGYKADSGHIAAALGAEVALQETGVDYRALAMPFFMDNLLQQATALREQGMIFMPNTADSELLMIATPDIGGVAVQLLTDPQWTGQDFVPVVSPDRLTPNQMAGQLSEVLGKEIRYQQVSAEQYAATLTQYGIAPGWVKGLVDMAVAQNDGAYYVQQREISDVAPTTFRAWAEKVLAPAVQNAPQQW